MAENKGSTPKVTKKITVTEKKPAQKQTTAPQSSRPAQKLQKSSQPTKPATRNKNTGAPAGKKPATSPQNRNGRTADTILPSDKLIHKIMPFVWFVVAVLLLLCLAFAENIGVVGEWLHIAFCGLFGIGAFLFIGLAVYLGFKWRKLIDSKRMVSRLVFIFLIIILFSALCQVFIMSNMYPDGEYPGAEALWTDGDRLIGGGLIGGTLGWLSYLGLKLIASAILIIAAIIVLAMLLFDVTPYDIAIRVRARRKLQAERREAEEYERREAEMAQQAASEESNYTKYRREQGIGAPAIEQNKVLKIVKRNPDPDVETEPEELYDDGFFDIKPESGAVIIDGEAEDVKEVKTDDEGETKPTEDTPFTLSEIFDEHNRSQLQANDENDNAEVLAVTMDTVSEPEQLEPEPDKPAWTPPPMDLLVEDKTSKADLSDAIAATKRKLHETLESFDIRVKDIGYSIGPTITRYEIFPDSGVRVRAIANLVDDIALNLAAGDIRIEAPIPNKPAVGVEVPNSVRATVRLRTLLDTDIFRGSSPLTVCLGQDVAGKNIFFDIKKMPHMIIAGTTGSGKSVCINCIVCSLLYKNPPDRVKLIMIDPKKVEFSIYQHIPHLYCPIISDSRKAAGALASAVAEMERRYTLIEDVGVRDIDSYNLATAKDPDREYLPKLIIVIDELADLMMMAKADVEQFITRIAQKARAVGIHLIIGTQRPSVDVITGLIKANVPSRIACTVKSQVDSRTILDIAGAEKLIGQGDMLFSPIGLAKPMRVQGAFLEDAEVARVIDFIKANNAPVEYNGAFMDSMEAAAANVGEKKTGGAALDAAEIADENGDAKFRQAVEIAVNEGKISTSLLQRKLEIGYGRAAKIIDRMEELGYVSEPDGNKPRRILITKQEFYEKVVNDDVTE